MTSIKSIAQLPDGRRHAFIHGSIVTHQGQPVDCATVEVRDLRGVKMATSLTDSAGSFLISTAVEPGEYVLLAVKELQISDQRINLEQPDLEVKIVLPVASGSTAGKPPQRYTVSAQELAIPEKARTHLTLAYKEFSKLNIAGAEKEIDRALEVDSMYAAAFSMQAFLRLASRDFDGALEAARRAVSLDPHDADGYLAQATAYNSSREFQKAEEASQQALGIRPDFWQGQLEMAKALYGQGRFVQALRELDALNRDFPDVHLVRGNVLMRLDRSQEAADEFGAFLREEPSDLRGEQIRRIVATVRKAAIEANSAKR